MHLDDDPYPEFAELRQAYVAGLKDRFGHLRSALEALRLSRADVAALQALIMAAHGIAGSAGTFGFREMGERARRLEAFAVEIQEAGRAPDADEFSALGQGVKEITAFAPRAESRPESPGKPGIATPTPSPERSRLVLVIDDDPACAAEISAQLRNYGFEVKSFSRTSDLRAAVHEFRPAAILMDVVFPEGGLHGMEAAKQVHAAAGDATPVIFVSGRADFAARLAAVRAGAAGYFVKPVDHAALADALDALLPFEPPPAMRVLLVEDDLDAARACSLSFAEAGIESRTVARGEDVPAAMHEFTPELILMDLHLPGCSGSELARVIRQDAANLAIPIVYLSAEGNHDRQLAAIRGVGDGFLLKPVPPAILVGEVSSRVQRARDLRSRMVRDGLTGAINHSAFMERLRHESALSLRNGRPLSLVILDVDNFKAINDSHGHAVGDQVLRTLCRILARRLRGTDLVGRLGGDEFAILLPGTEPAAAREVLESIRSNFLQADLSVLRPGVHATFSAGIASSPPARSPGELLMAADAALYEAKRTGRNRVVAHQAGR